jgi:ABC-type maltose transport system permease subunit
MFILLLLNYLQTLINTKLVPKNQIFENFKPLTKMKNKKGSKFFKVYQNLVTTSHFYFIFT